MLPGKWNYMNKRILEDIKFKNTTPKILTPKENVDIKSVPISKPIVASISSIQNIPESANKYEFLKKKKPIQSYTKRISETPQMRGSKPFNKNILYLFIFALLIGSFYLFSTVFFEANITIVPKNQSFELKDESFTSSKKNDIPFEVMIVEDTLSKDVILTSSKEVADKAQGEITLFNEYAKTAQKITAGSFVADEAGKSYKIDKTILIPGYTLSKENKIIPGQIVVGITSFIAGEAYNGSPTSFYVTSFKSTDKYKKIYGKLKTSLSGGMAGLVYVVDENEKALALKNVSKSEERLMLKLDALVPQGYILYPNAVNFSYDVVSDEYSKTPNTKLDVKGTLAAFLLKETDLTSVLINKVLPDISEKEKTEILKPELLGLSFSFVDKNQTINKDTDSFDFKLKGNMILNWSPNINELKSLLLGKNKNEVPDIFKTDPGIKSASVSIIPFWSKILPDVAEKINIIIKK